MGKISNVAIIVAGAIIALAILLTHRYSITADNAGNAYRLDNITGSVSRCVADMCSASFAEQTTAEANTRREEFRKAFRELMPR